MVVTNNGDGNCAGRNAVKLTTHWLWGFFHGQQQRGSELGQISPTLSTVFLLLEQK